ncbi:MAG TPA: glycosyltransferase family 4 protein [bacterium]|nr:glycosyltransferase family 4 protein [bacterium]
MRILFANKYYYLKGGCERVLFTEMELLRSHGHQVAVFASDHPSNETAEFSDLFTEREDYFEAGWGHKAKAALKIIYSPEAYSKFGRVIDLFKPDLVHAHNIYAQLSTAVLDAAKDRGVPVVLTAHDYKLVCPSYMMLDHGSVCEKCIGGHYYHSLLTGCHKESRVASAVYMAETYFNTWFKKYDSVRKFICPSGFIKSKLASRFAPDRMTVLNNPVDLASYVPVFRDEGYYLFTGRLSKEKGVFTLIRAFAEMGLPLKIAGTGPLERECRQLARGVPNIQMTGYKGGRDLAALYQGARACVVPSEWYENAPLSVIEPLAYAKPVIAARIGGIPELIQEGRNGLLFNAFDPADLKRKVRFFQQLLPSQYRSFCSQARISAQEQFSTERHYAALMQIYLEASGIKGTDEGVGSESRLEESYAAT